MDFEPLDGYLLDGRPSKPELLKRLLREPPPPAQAAPFFEGIRLLGQRTPDLALIALRLVLGGKKADDDAVSRLRAIVERARRGDAGAREAYRTELE